MGKSDSLIFPVYESLLDTDEYESIAFLGFTQENEFTQKLKSAKRDFYDMQLGNWNINEDWSLKGRYDLIVCTRCAYFSKAPSSFIEKCRNHLTEKGHALIDWGLGDHWRFKKYKVGWVRDGEHEYAYEPENFLYSCFWNETLIEDNEVKEFWKYVVEKDEEYYAYQNIADVVKNEVPTVVDYPAKKIRTKFLWKDSPQLYIATLLEK